MTGAGERGSQKPEGLADCAKDLRFYSREDGRPPEGTHTRGSLGNNAQAGGWRSWEVH